MTTENTNTERLSPRAEAEVRSIVSCAEASMNLPANDNAGLAWRVADAEPHEDDHRYEIAAYTRIARKVAEHAETALRGTWYASKHYSLGCVRLRTWHPASNATRRREKTLRGYLAAAGWES